MRTRMIIAVAVLTAIVIGALALVRNGKTPSSANSTSPNLQSGGRERSHDKCFSGYGWSINADTTKAVTQAIDAASRIERRSPQIIFVVYTHQHSPEQVVKAVRARLGPQTAIYGCSSDFGIIAPDGYHCSDNGVVGVLAMKTDKMNIGVGSADLDEANSPEACATLALERAKTQAGISSKDDVPSMVLMCPTYDGMEERYVQAITTATGGEVPILGGTAGGTDLRGTLDCSAIANDKVVRKGLVVAVFRSTEPFGWAFGGGFSRTGKSGVVTASTGREILQIDGRPALDVYDEWTGGMIKQAVKAGENPRKVTALYPLCRSVGSEGNTSNLFIHMWPSPSGPADGRLVSSANLSNGDVVHFSEGSWNILLNWVGQLPKLAKKEHPSMPVEAGFLICCEGIIMNIPESERNQIAQLLNHEFGDVPWLGTFTWGEQGNFHGIGNYHGNLLAGLTLFPDVASKKNK